MPRLLQISVLSNMLSIGKICEDIAITAQSQGWETYIAYGRRAKKGASHEIRIAGMWNTYLHYIESKLFDNEGLSSRFSTLRLIRKIRELKPDVIQLHDLHDHYLNYPMLFRFLKESGIPTVWTQHDCWAFTGGCFHYTLAGCQQWQFECENCIQKNGLLCHRSKKQFELRKSLFSSMQNLTIVTVSNWLEGEVRKSLLKHLNVLTIHNSIDLSVFKPTPSNAVRHKYGIGSSKYVIGVAAAWGPQKGLDDYIKLNKLLKDSDIIIVLVGVQKSVKEMLPKNIIAIPRTTDSAELASLYTEAEIVLNLSYQETFGMTTVEGYACGTPGIVYNCTASPELMSRDTGYCVDAGDVDAVASAIKLMLNLGKKFYSDKCLEVAREKYDKSKQFMKYVTLYNNLVSSKLRV